MTSTPPQPPPDKTLPAAVLWDMDGTLVDTEPYWISGEFELAAMHGGPWSDEDAHAVIGQELVVSATRLRDVAGVPWSTDEIIEWLLAWVQERLRGAIPWRPGAKELLDSLRTRGVPMALVTMSWRVLADEIVAALPAGTFATVVTGDEVTAGKPAPDPYLAACAALGVVPADCVALEDSVTGVASAVAAGVPTLAIPHVVQIPSDSGAQVIGTLSGVNATDLVRLARP